MKRFVSIFIFAVAATGATIGSYIMLERFLRDRQSVMSYKTLPPRPVYDRPSNQNGKQAKTYTAKELEEARRKGQLPPGAQPLPPTQPNLANEAAVQRSLRTLDEINKINQMNQRLLEQQQRMQNQR